MIPADWKPTAENINALPDPLRRYIHNLETDADPAGTIRQNVLTRDENAMLRRKVGEQDAEIERLRAALRRIRDGGEVSCLAGNPALWLSTIAADALSKDEQSTRQED